MTFQEALSQYRSNQGRTLEELSRQSAVLVVFLRHLGCTFCRETVRELAAIRRPLEQNGIRVVFVHMSAPEDGQTMVDTYGMPGAETISDPDRVLYRAFELQRTTTARLFSPWVLARALPAMIRYGVAAPHPKEDKHQMPGVFLLRDGAIEKRFHHTRISDRPDYAALADCDLCDPETAVASEKFSTRD